MTLNVWHNLFILTEKFMTSLKDKFVFITGASSGIGAACARQFAAQGANLLLCARRLEKLQKLSEEIASEYHVKVHCFELDVRHKKSVTKVIDALTDEWKLVDILINNAGLAAGFDTLQEGSIQDWEDMIDTNVKGLLYITKAILPGMITRNKGHVINLGSVAGHYVYPKGAVYCASKFAVNAISNGLRMDLLGTKIRVSTVDPGAVETSFSLVRFKGDEKRASAVYEGIEPLTADDVASAILYCASCPPHVNISEIIIMPTDQAAATMFARKT
jgi:NADP-dependent 3-hydroxy acid dehydrogenase YdfG